VCQPVLETEPQPYVNNTSDCKNKINNTEEGLDDKSCAILDARKQAVDELLEEFITSISAPTADDRAPIPTDDDKVVLVTGGSGSLGARLVYHLAQLDDVKTVVCLNRKHREDAVTRQLKAMSEKGIRFPNVLKSKLLVLQTKLDTAP